MVLTEEVQQDKYPVASLEPTKIATEKLYYDIKDAQVVDKATATGITNYLNDNGIGNNPTDAAFSATNSTKLYQLNSNTAKTGLGITLKVMAGDKIDVLGKSYYFTNTVGTSGNSTVPIIDLLTAFLSAPAAAATTAGHGLITPAIINTPTGITGITNMATLQNTQSNTTPTKPRAFINVIFFDEQFKAFDYKISMVGTNSVVKDHFTDLQNLMATKSGYVYIYCSNESPVNVFFDNLQVVQTRGPILSEDSYYPFGLTMAGISSKAAGKMENRYKFNGGTEFNNDFDISFYETQCRSYDPQIGRFLQIDELAEGAWEWTPYQFALDNPIRLNDPLGLEAEEAIADGGKKRKHKFNEEQTLSTVVVRSVKKLNHEEMQSVYWRLRDAGKGFGGVSDKLRERLERWDGIQRFMEDVHRQTREQDMIALEIAANFIPVGWITKLKYVKYAANLFKLKRGLAAAELLAKAKPLITILGKYPNYVRAGEEMGYNIFNIEKKVWDGMTEIEQLAANSKFIADAVARGDEIIFSHRVAAISGETGAFREELEQLGKAGYHLAADGLGMVK